MENNDTLEVIQRIPLDKLRPYPDHPFGVRDDDMMQQTVESIKQFGVLVPGIARPLPDGTFELIAGHRRKQASAVVSKPGILIQCVPSGEKLHFLAFFTIQRPFAILMADEVVQTIVGQFHLSTRFQRE